MESFHEIKRVLINGNPNSSEPKRRFEAVAKIAWLFSIVGHLAFYFGGQFMLFDGFLWRMGGTLMILNLFLIYYVAWTNNTWAKWVFLTFQVIGFGIFLTLSSSLLNANLFGFLITLFQYELGLYSIYLLFELDRRSTFKWLSRTRKE